MGRLFTSVIEMSISSVFLILFVIVIRNLFNRMSKKFMSVLWLLVAIKLIIPVSFEVPIVLFQNFTPISENVISEIQRENMIFSSLEQDFQSNRMIAEESNWESYEPDNSSNVDSGQQNNNVDISDASRIDDKKLIIEKAFECFTIIWLLGILTFFAYDVFSNVQIIRRVRESIKQKTYKNVFFCDDIDTPFVFGVLNPKIYIPSGIDEEVLKNVIAHEMAHIKRADHIRKQVGYIILAIHWFNPLVWVSYILFCRDIEYACDEKVVCRMSLEGKKSYALSLLFCSTRQKTTISYPIAFGEIAVKKRIKQAFNYKKVQVWMIILFLCTCTFIFALFFTHFTNSTFGKDNSGLFDVVRTISNEGVYDVGNSLTLDESQSIFDVNHYYNVSTKVYDGRVFVEKNDGIYEYDNNSNIFKKITDKYYSLGAVAQNGLYLCEIVLDDNSCRYNLVYLDAGDYSISILDDDIDLSNSEGVSNYLGMYVDGEKLYIEGASCCLTYIIHSDTDVEFESKQANISNNIYPLAAIYSAGLNNAELIERDDYLVGNLKITKYDNSVEIYENVRDVTLTPYGALVRKGKEDNDIYFIDFESDSMKLVYDLEEHQGIYGGYNTYDQDGFYGMVFKENNKYALIYCSWEGESKELYEYTSDELILGVDANMSIVDKWLYFYDYNDHDMKRINVMDGSIEKI